MEIGSRILCEEVLGYSGRAVRVPRGATIMITDVEGAQIGDVFALSADDLGEYLDAAETRTVTRRLFPAVGQMFTTNRHRPILTLVEDRSPGKHDMLLPTCCPRFYADCGVVGWHPSCEENFGKALAELGLHSPIVPQPVNIFQNTPVLTDGRILVEPAESKPGDAILFRTEMDIVLVVTACSVDVGGEGAEDANGGQSTPLRIEVYS